MHTNTSNTADVIDLTAAIEATGGRFRATATRALWTSVFDCDPQPIWLIAFAKKLRQVARGAPGTAFIDLSDGWRLFAFPLPGSSGCVMAKVRVVDEAACSVDLATADDTERALQVMNQEVHAAAILDGPLGATA